jgi:hypothetical protein
MSTIKSSADHIVINADGASKDIKFQANGVEKASISSAGAFTSTTIDATKLTGNLPAISGASLTNLPASGITEADQWRVTSDSSVGTDVTYNITANWERADTDGFGKLGTGVTESSGVFSFPSTGYWEVTFKANIIVTSDARYVWGRINSTTNNSTYDVASSGYSSANITSSSWYTDTTSTFLFDVTDTSTHKIKLTVSSISGGTLNGDSNNNITYVTFIKLGET